jgi:hypothetical protein
MLCDDQPLRGAGYFYRFLSLIHLAPYPEFSREEALEEEREAA